MKGAENYFEIENIADSCNWYEWVLLTEMYTVKKIVWYVLNRELVYIES